MVTANNLRQNDSLSIHWTTDAFEVDGVSYEGVPIFIRPASMQIEIVPTMYFLHVCIDRGNTRSFKTWRQYAYSMLPVLRYMEARGANWMRPTERQLAHYRNTLTKRSVSLSRIARVIYIICDFYEWMLKEGRLNKLPFTYVEERRRTRAGFLGYVAERSSSRKPSIAPRNPLDRTHPRYFDGPSIKKLLDASDERGALIIKWALYTGIREFELCELLVSQIRNPQLAPAKRAMAVRITGKGGVVADLCVPKWLIQETYRYIKFFGRRKFVESLKAQGRANDEHLFLSRHGKKLKPDSLYREFRKTRHDARIIGRFHDLRHTYAITMLHRLMTLERHKHTDGLNALNELKTLMRHASFTSLEIYLKARRFYLDIIDSDLFELPDDECA